MIATVFTLEGVDCKLCDQAQELLKEHGYEVYVTPLTEQELTTQFGSDFTIPQIFLGHMFLGSYEKLVKKLGVAPSARIPDNHATVISPSAFKCTYCTDAVNVLKENGYKVTLEKWSNEELTKVFGVNFTVPKIRICNQDIGGLSDLLEYLKTH
jgi:glutaredoxin